MIIRARCVVTMDGPPIENGAVAINQGIIVDVAPFNWIKAKYGDEIIDLGERALLPGLINAHCHLDYTCLRDKMPRRLSFADWIRMINASKAALTPPHYVRSINEGFAEARKFGTTSIVNLTAFPELIPQVRAHTRTWWMAELIDVRAPEKAEEILQRAIGSLPAVETGGFAPHAPFTASRELYRLCQKQSALLTTHLAESDEEMQMFRDQAGPLYDFIRGLNPNFESGGRTPLAYFLEVLDAGSPWLIAHLNELTESDFELLRKRKSPFQIVHCPRSHEFFGHSPFKYDQLRALGFLICLGTDSLASNDDLSLFAEMRTFQKNEGGVSPEEILMMTTVNGARALRKADVLGKLHAGFWADMIAIPFVGSDRDVWEEIVAFDQPVNFSMVNGKIGGEQGGFSQF